MLGGDEILFYGVPVDTRYADTNIYWLTVDTEEPGLRIGETPAEPGSGTRPEAFTDTLRVEEDLFYDPLTPSAPAEDRFYWRRLITGVPSTPMLQAAAGEVLHYGKRQAVVFAHLVHLHHV